MRKLLTIIFFCSSYLFANETLEVQLSTQNPLIPVYISQFDASQSIKNKEHLHMLSEVFTFDLSHCGYFFVVPVNKEKEDFLQTASFDYEYWKKQKIFFVVSLHMQKDFLLLHVYSIEKKKAKEYRLPLEYDSVKDRKSVHAICDCILSDFLQKRGIASSSILYSIRTKNPDADSKKKWLSEIWMTDYDGFNPRQLTYENDYCVHPLFVPCKGKPTHYIYVTYKKGQPKIYGAPLYQKAEASAIISLRGNQLLPSLSLDAMQLAFISDAAGRPDLFLQRFDRNGLAIDKPLQLFSAPRATQASPSFAPDGKKLAFVSDKDGGCRIYVIRLPDENFIHKRPLAHLITKKNRENVTPAWSPDGTKLAYSAKRDGIRQIWVYDFETDEEWMLTKGSKHKENPAWAPDSIHLVYNTEDKTDGELFLIDIYQKIPEQISKGWGQKRFPSWEPSPLQERKL